MVRNFFIFYKADGLTLSVQQLHIIFDKQSSKRNKAYLKTMGIFTKFEKVRKENQNDSLRVTTKNNETTFEGGLSVFKMIDSDTSQHIIYIPALNLTSYGDTYKKAEEMMKFCIADLFELLGKITPKKRDEELTKLGWKRNKLKNKEFSKLLVDPKGVLQNFNISESSIERLTLVTH